MIQENYCSFIQSQILKEKGFPQGAASCFYSPEGIIIPYFATHTYIKRICDAPSQAFAQKWLREEKGIFINIIADTDYPDWTGNWEYSYDLTYNLKGKTTSWCYDKFKTYEEALYAGINKALELI